MEFPKTIELEAVEKASLKFAKNRKTPSGNIPFEVSVQGGDGAFNLSPAQPIKANCNYELRLLVKASSQTRLRLVIGDDEQVLFALPFWRQYDVSFKAGKPEEAIRLFASGKFFIAEISLRELPPDAPLAREWTLRLPSQQEKTVELKDSVLDIAKLAGDFKEKDKAEFSNRFVCKAAGAVRLGVSADWWISIKINGVNVFTTMPIGNILSNFRPNDHILEIPVKAGENELRAEVLAGSKGWLFACGKPANGLSATAMEPMRAAVRTPGQFEIQDAWKLDWDELSLETQRIYNPPASMHLALQLPRSRDFIHFEPGFALKRRRIYDEAFSGQTVIDLQEKEFFTLAFAFGKEPCVPDWHRTRFTLAEGRYPVATASYGYSAGLRYALKAYCSQLPSGKMALWTELSVLAESSAVANDLGISSSSSEKSACVWARFDWQQERKFVDNEYGPCTWNASKWLPCERVSYEGNVIKLDGHAVGMVFPDDCTLSSNVGFELGKTPDNDLQLLKIDKALRADLSFSAGETKSFTIGLIIDCEKASDSDLKELAQARKTALEASLADFKRVEAKAKTALRAPYEHWEDIFSSMQLQSEQLMVLHEGAKHLTPTQGGVHYRHFMWVWEAAAMLQPLLRCGRFEAVKDAVEAIFSMQDRGSMPEGHLNSTAGCIGTTALRWLNTTGAALSLATAYYSHSKDKEFLKSHLPKILKAADWIINELRHTRVLNPDGSRPDSYGIMPFGRANDGDIGHFPCFTDSVLLKGLEDVAALLEELGHARKEEIKREAAQYCADLAETTRRLAEPEGYIRRHLPGAQCIENAFERVGGALGLFECGALPVDAAIAEKYLRYYEENMIDGPFPGITHETDKAYLTILEKILHEVYLQRGEWKKAFAIFRSNMNYALAPDTWLVAERFSKTESSYVPFQPNGSGCGRTLDMLLNSLHFEYRDAKGRQVTLLCGGLPPAYLKRNGKLSLQDLHTAHGKVSIEAEHLGGDKAKITLSGSLPELVRLPDFLQAKKVAGAKKSGKGFFKMLPGAKRFEAEVLLKA